MSSNFSLIVRDEDDVERVVFQATSPPGLHETWQQLGIYEYLANSDGEQARDISRQLGYALDRLQEEMVEPTGTLICPESKLQAAVDFLSKVVRRCTMHPEARIRTS